MSVTTDPHSARLVDLPEGTSGNVELRRIVIADHEPLLAFRGRGTRPGTYTGLYRNGSLWMSDTQAEWSDHLPAYWQISKRGGRVLINGLGLGMIVKAALELPNVEHVDVVEIDPDVIDLVGPHYASNRCTIHHADAYEIRWTVGTRWTVAWHDIWKDICEDNLARMTKLHRKYGRRVDWQESWSRQQLLHYRRRTANEWWRR